MSDQTKTNLIDEQVLKQEMRLILHLPSHVTLLFITILVIVSVVLGLGFQTRLQPFVQVSIFFSCIQTFLALALWPNRTQLQNIKHTLHLQKNLETVQATVRALAQAMGVQPTPQVEISKHDVGVHAVGAFQQRIIVAGEKELTTLAENIEANQHQPVLPFAKATLAHELQHFLRHDTRYLELTHQFLKAIILWGVVTSLFAIGFYATIQTLVADTLPLLETPDYALAKDLLYGPTFQLFLIPITGTFFSSEVIEYGLAHMDFRPLIINLLLSFIPIVIGGFFWWRLVFRRMTQVREFYADFGAAITVSISALKEALFQSESNTPTSPLRPRFGFNYHPTSTNRRRALKAPIEILTDPIENGKTIGGMLLFMHLLLTGMFTVRAIAQWSPHLGVIIGFIAIATLMTPLTLTQTSAIVWRKLVICAVVTSLIGFAWNIIFILLGWWALNTLATPELDALAGLIVGIDALMGSPSLNQAMLSYFDSALKAAPLMLILGWGLLLLSLWLDMHLKQRILLPLSADYKHLTMRCWGITGTIACGLLTVINAISVPLVMKSDVWQLLTIIFVQVISLIGASIGGWWIWKKYRFNR